MDPSIDCKQKDCPYYGHYTGGSDDTFYESLGLSKKIITNDIYYSNNRKNEIDCKIRQTCDMCIYLPQERIDMKAYVLKETAKRLLLKRN